MPAARAQPAAKTTPRSPRRKSAARRKAPPVKVPARPTPPERIPRVVADPTPADHLAIITRAIFQAGLSWSALDQKWPVFEAAFDGFAVATVATYGERDIARIMATPGMIRSAKKIAGTVRNAQALLALEREYGSVRTYQTSADYATIQRDTGRRFAYLGDAGTYYWLFRSGAPVPPFARWIKGQKRDHPRIREMLNVAENGSSRSGAQACSFSSR